MAEVVDGGGHARERVEARGKLVHLQILRALAASLVVVDHSFSFLDYNVHRGGEYLHAGYLAGYSGVTVFFVLSGFIMFRQSAGLFGSMTSTLVFWWRRLIRIVPMYWMAVCWTFWIAWREHWALPRLGTQFLLQMTFIPDFVSRRDRLAPMMQLGWTLNYEMAFYLLFGICLLFCRRTGLTALLFALYGLVALHSAWGYILGAGSPGALVAGVYTDPLILLFGYGALLGFLIVEIPSTNPARLRISPAFALLIPSTLFLVWPTALGSKNLWDLLNVFSVFLVLLCAVTAQGKMGRLGRMMVLFGDASYCTYLFHLHVYSFLHGIDPWKLQSHPIAFMTVAVVCANLFGLAMHTFVESPLTNALRRIRFGNRQARTLEAIPDTVSMPQA